MAKTTDTPPLKYAPKVLACEYSFQIHPTVVGRAHSVCTRIRCDGLSEELHTLTHNISQSPPHRLKTGDQKPSHCRFWVDPGELAETMDPRAEKRGTSHSPSKSEQLSRSGLESKPLVESTAASMTCTWVVCLGTKFDVRRVGQADLQRNCVIRSPVHD